MDEFESITIVDEGGEEKDVTLIFSYTDETTGRVYYLFAEDEDQEEDEAGAYVFYRDPDTEEDELLAIESEEEYNQVTEVLDSVLGSIETND